MTPKGKAHAHLFSPPYPQPPTLTTCTAEAVNSTPSSLQLIDGRRRSKILWCSSILLRIWEASLDFQRQADTARAFVPKNLRLVEAFGYTLGGFFLANYQDSPAGSFDELVVIAGIVWNPPTSCAWAARVLVSSEDACHHGRKEVGLPSHVAKFSKRTMAVPVNQKSRDSSSFLNLIGLGASVSTPTDCSDVQVAEVVGHSQTNICNISLATLVPGMKLDQWTGPMMRLSLPSFSGRTEYSPDLLKYSCNLKCRVRAVKPAIASSMRMQDWEEDEESGTVANKKGNLTLSILLSRPVLALEFTSLEMKVGAPIVVSDLSTKNNSCGKSLGVA